MNNKSIVLSVAVFGLILLSVAAWFFVRPMFMRAAIPTEQTLAVLRPHSPIIGPEDAPVTIVEFFDPTCEACRKIYPVVRDIMAEYGDTVRLAIRYVAFEGKGSVEAIRVLEVARKQGVFQPVLEALLRDQKRWAKDGAPEQELIIQISTEAGLDPEAARTQMLEPIIAATINQDRADAEVLGVTQTPTFFVNGRSVNSFGEAELRALVNEEVAASRK
ncbi:disulfide bond formation protein DsbA (plasmid) [Roseibium algicola]|jgi:protein-disulfide isomerase|uniref:Disulfide bond formation protein DsbA n=1 Tax=Roseibium algicola TaxID=2857014 RepID=A0ABM6ICA8_9HYPH|nr:MULTISPECIES: thioredoxin domain-containing protein [Stappiaceae]AMN56346.1 DSBA oxidoreductase [Labrenzia sp. CP4]AQQ08181.1 disulfide bond formation protein DsbA [Roseibium aggregatum]MBO9463430.1 thioredoxin domain-containing protein [Labrenzia sp. R5_0]QFT01935.1 Disulfide bond formation protein D precursor [Labrenzia sp. THAF191b]QFT07778.1 Disulfide bond formation protein D precursor [Labrenzia sp. THAF191a]